MSRVSRTQQANTTEERMTEPLLDTGAMRERVNAATKGPWHFTLSDIDLIEDALSRSLARVRELEAERDEWREKFNRCGENWNEVYHANGALETQLAEARKDAERMDELERLRGRGVLRVISDGGSYIIAVSTSVWAKFGSLREAADASLAERAQGEDAK